MSKTCCPLAFTTGASYEDARLKSEAIVDFLKTTTINVTLDETVVRRSDRVLSDLVRRDSDMVYFPMVVNLIAPGRSGKDTFASLVDKHFQYGTTTTSCVDPARVVSNTLIDNLHILLANTLPYVDNPVPSVDVATAQKDDAYRQLLHDVKDAFTTYCDGPVLHALGIYMNAVQKVTYTRNAADERKYSCGIVFVNNRDQDTVDRLRDWCYQLGICFLSVYVKGPVSASEYVNSCDSTVDHIPVDITISNQGDLAELEEKAKIFSIMLTWAMRTYGTELKPSTDFDTLVEQGRKAMNERQSSRS